MLALAWALLSLGCSDNPSAIAPDAAADAPPDRAMVDIIEAVDANDAGDANAVAPETADRPDAIDPDLRPDRSPETPDMEAFNVCEGPDAGAGCGKRFNACCNTVPRCQGSLRCGADGVCHDEDCGGFMQKCCCAGGARRRCGPDLLCNAGLCSQP